MTCPKVSEVKIKENMSCLVFSSYFNFERFPASSDISKGNSIFGLTKSHTTYSEQLPKSSSFSEIVQILT